MQLGVYDKDVDVFLSQIDRRSSYYAEQGQVPEWFSDIMLIHKEIYLARPARARTNLNRNPQIYPEDRPKPSNDSITKPIQQMTKPVEQMRRPIAEQQICDQEEEKQIIQPEPQTSPEKHEENFECIDETDGCAEVKARAGDRTRPLVESMLARSLAWQFLKTFGKERPRVVIVRATCATAKIDIQKYKKSAVSPQKLDMSSNPSSHR